MKLVKILRHPVNVFRREWIGNMTATTTNRGNFGAVGVAAHTTFIERAGTGRVVMTSRAILTKISMHGMIKVDTVKKFNHCVKRYLLRHVSCLSQGARRNEGQNHHQGSQDLLSAHDSLSFDLSTERHAHLLTSPGFSFMYL
jgi:hypothetical protein